MKVRNGNMQIELKILNKEFYVEEAIADKYLPKYATPGSAAIDLICTKYITIYPGETKQIPTGIAIHIGSHTDESFRIYRDHWDYAGLILPRSGLGTKGLILANTIGLIDSDYQGEILVQAWNRNYVSKEDKENCDSETPCGHIELKTGDRFAQLLIIPIAKAQWKVVDTFTNNTDRSNKGFGSTGE